VSPSGDDATGPALALTSTSAGAVRFEVTVRPRARRSAVSGVRAGALVVSVAAPPVDGAANTELLATIAARLSIPARDVVLVRGAGSRKKVVEVRGLTAETVRARLVE
jgi:uncharacterized protein